jgi:uncharacterized protein (TIGR03437 family)
MGGRKVFLRSALCLWAVGCLHAQSSLTITSTSPLPQATRGQAYSFQFASSGGSGTFRAWSLGGVLPAGLSLSASGLLSGTPTAAGTFEFTIRVTDNFFQASKVFVLTVANPLAITSSSPLPDGFVQTSYSQQLAASGGTSPYSWILLSGPLPPGLNLSSSGLISGTPTQAGEFVFTVRVNDQLNRLDSRQFSLTIRTTQTQLSITTSSLPEGTVGQTYSAALAATGGSPPYTFGVAPGSALPPGLNLSSTGGISGVPTAAGQYTTVFQVFDRLQGSATRSLPIVIRAPAALSITTASLPGGTVGATYEAALAASGGTPPYRWSLASGSLPPGLSLTTGGQISGTPSAAGTFGFTVRVQDAANGNATRGLSITMAAAGGPLLVLTESLPGGVLGQQYAERLIAGGGVTPYAWTVVSGVLPPGLTLQPDGLVSGVPEALGSFPFTARVADSAQQTAARQYTIVIEAPRPGLQFSARRLLFEAAQGGAPPPAQGLALISGDQAVPYVLQVDGGSAGTSAPAWLRVTPMRGTTPQRCQVAVDPTGVLPGQYKARIVTLDQGVPLAVEVEFDVLSRTPRLSVAPEALRFAGPAAALRSAEQSLLVRNGGGAGSLPFQARSSADWLEVSPASGIAQPGTAAALAVRVNPARLSAGAYTGQIRITSGAGESLITVTALLRPEGPVLGLDQPGVRFSTRSGQGSPLAQSVHVLSLGEQALDFRADVVEGASWLSLSPASGRLTPGSVSALTLTPNAAALAPGAYYALVRISAEGALNSPQYLTAVLDVRDANAPLEPELTPGGLVFVAPPGTTPAVQRFRIWTPSLTAAAFRTSVLTLDGGDWLAVSPGAGNVSSQQPISPAVSVNPAGLAPGVYRGEISVALSALPVRTVAVTLIVPRVTTGTAARKGESLLAGCTPTKVEATLTSLGGGFSSPVSWPVSLVSQVSDNCGDPVSNGRVTYQFSNGDPPLTASVSNPARGIYAASWTPLTARSPVSVRLEASAPGLTPDVREVAGDATANATPAPVAARDAVVNPFYRVAGSALAPGTLVEIYGSNLTSTAVEPKILPLPRSFNNTTVVMGGTTIPLFYLSPGQINVQLPFEFAPNREYAYVVTHANAFSMPQSVVFSAVQPGLLVVGQKLDGSLVSAESPARPGEYLQLYLLGMGVTNPAVASGEASPGAEPLGRVAAETSVTIGGQPAPFVYAGLTPGLVGLFQINVQVPPNLATGEHEVVVTAGGQSSNSFKLAVRRE